MCFSLQKDFDSEETGPAPKALFVVPPAPPTVWGGRLPRRELVALDLALAQGGQEASQDSLAVLAPRIDADAPADADDARRLVDVAVQSEHRLGGADRHAHRLCPRPAQ